MNADPSKNKYEDVTLMVRAMKWQIWIYVGLCSTLGWCRCLYFANWRKEAVEGVRNPACLLHCQSLRISLWYDHLYCLKFDSYSNLKQDTPQQMKKTPIYQYYHGYFCGPFRFSDHFPLFIVFLRFAVAFRYSSGNLKQEELPEKPILDVTLEPGDVLYVPCVIRSKLYLGWQSEPVYISYVDFNVGTSQEASFIKQSALRTPTPFMLRFRHFSCSPIPPIPQNLGSISWSRHRIQYENMLLSSMN